MTAAAAAAPPVGLWASAGIHYRAFGRRPGGRLVAAVSLGTSSWRVEQCHAVATVVARDLVSMMTWGVATVLTNAALWLVLAPALLGSVPAVLLVPVLFVAASTVTVGLGQRIAAWRAAAGCRGALVISNVAADPRGQGYGTGLMAAIVDFADSVDRALVLLVDPSNEPALRLYRRFGFVTDERVSRRRLRMVRPASLSAAPGEVPSWLLPIRVGASAVVAAAAAGVLLVALYWGSPGAWLMVPFVGLASLAADNDARTLRIPNRLVAASASLVVMAIAFTAIAFDDSIVLPSVAGAAILGAPLYVSHVMSHRGTGLGDAKLGAVLGLVAGAVSPSAAYATLLVSMLLGIGVGLVWRRKRRGGFPLAPALAAGTTLVLALWPVLEGPTTW